MFRKLLNILKWTAITLACLFVLIVVLALALPKSSTPIAGTPTPDPTQAAAVATAAPAAVPAAANTPKPTTTPDATATPRSTATPQVTATPEASATPKPTATTAVTDTSEQRFARIAVGGCDYGKLQSSSLKAGKAEIICDGSDFLNLALFDEVEYEWPLITPAIFDIPEVQTFSYSFTASFTDAFGNDKTEDAIRILITRPVVQKIHFSTALMKLLFQVLPAEEGCSVDIHPAYQRDWRLWLALPDERKP